MFNKVNWPFGFCTSPKQHCFILRDALSFSQLHTLSFLFLPSPLRKIQKKADGMQARSVVIFSSTHKHIWSGNWAKNTAFFISCRNRCVNERKEQSVFPLFWTNLAQTKHCFGCASVTGNIKNVLGTSLLCQECSCNVAPLQPRIFVGRWSNNTALLVQEKYNAKLVTTRYSFCFSF